MHALHLTSGQLEIPFGDPEMVVWYITDLISRVLINNIRDYG